MSRFSGPNSHGFSCRKYVFMGVPVWRMSWSVDHYYANSTQRFPRRYRRDTEDEKAAMRFCLKHSIIFPGDSV